MTDLSCNLDVRVLSSERDGIGVCQLLADYVAVTEAAGTIIVAAGYQTDFASIPRPMRPLLCTMGKSARAALLHDWLLHLNDKRANKVFLEALKASNVSFVGRHVMFAFVWLTTFFQLHWGEPG